MLRLRCGRAGEPLFSSHALLSEEPHEESVAVCGEYLKRMAPLELVLEVELGLGGTATERVAAESLRVHRSLAPTCERFTIACPGLRPEGLDDLQRHAKATLRCDEDKVSAPRAAASRASERPRATYACRDVSLPACAQPLALVVHGGAGTEAEVCQALGHGVVKVNLDAETWRAYWEGVRQQLRGSEGDPGEALGDPTRWLREGEASMCERAMQACRAVNNVNR